MPKTMLPEHLARALEAGVGPLDVIQGHIKNEMAELQNSQSEYDQAQMDVLTDLYTMCYDIAFYLADLEKDENL